MLIDIVILPPKNVRRKIGTKVKKEIGDLPNFFVVDDIKLIPHLSLWHMRTSKQKLGKATEDLKQIVKGHKPIKITSSKFQTLEKYKGNLEFLIKNNKDLDKLQKNIFSKIYIHKTGAMPKLAPFLKLKYTKEKLKAIKKYGRSTGFSPHFTMGWLKKEKDIAGVVEKMQKTKFSFWAKEVYVCEVDKWWQVKRIIKKIEF